MAEMQFDPNNLEGVDPQTADESAALGYINMKLENIIKMLPQLAANQNIKHELIALKTNTVGSINRIKGELRQQRSADLPD